MFAIQMLNLIYDGLAAGPQRALEQVLMILQIVTGPSGSPVKFKTLCDDHYLLNVEIRPTPYALRTVHSELCH